jgi:hypothetical protein
MAQLPDAAALGERPVPQGAGSVASYEPPNWRQVGMSGQFVQGAGRDLEEASQVVAATNERQDQIVAQAAANNLQQKATVLEFDPDKGFRNAREGNAVGKGFIDANTQQFSDATTQIRTALLNDNQRRAFDQHAAVLGARFQSALLSHQAQETDKFNDSTADNSIKLALSGMATRPTDELNFQSGLVQINGTIDALAKRKGLPEEQTKALKQTYLDAAYSTRITSVMNGIPGVAPANPYDAERMFKQVQDQLGPASQVHLAHEVQRAVQSVQARDTASSFIFGRPPPAPSTIPAAGKPLQVVVESMESGGRDTDANGNLLTSPAGAQGRMQVMPATSANPGYGVTPARDNSPQELARVGRDYLGAMSARYGDPALTLAAYNAGPARVDKWLEQYGDPRTGQISVQDWASKIPFAETQAYVTNGLKKMAAQAGQPDASVQAPTANQLKQDLYARVQAARSLAEQQYPGDTAYADSVAARVENYGRTVIANQQGVEAGARDGLFQGLVGEANGSNKPLSIDALLADPQMKRNWDAATPETKLAIQAHFKNGAGDPPRTSDSQATLYKYMGMAVNNRQAFANEDLSPLIATLPHADFDRLATLQMGARNKQELAAEKGANLQHALGLALNYALKPMGIQEPTKDTPQSKRDAFNQFTGALTVQLDQFQQQNKRPANDKEIVSMARNLTSTVQVPGNWFGTRDLRAFEITPENVGTVTAKIPDAERAAITAAFAARGNAKPTEQQIQTAYIMARRPDLAGAGK